MVSLSQFAEVTEEGVLFASPFTGEPTMLTVSPHPINHPVLVDCSVTSDMIIPFPCTARAKYRHPAQYRKVSQRTIDQNEHIRLRPKLTLSLLFHLL